MAQAQIALETRRARHAARQRFATYFEHMKQRREARRLLARMLAERESGFATGARV
jgi:hypothetical protein